MSLASQLPPAVPRRGTLVLVGGSVRAAAQDAAQVGWQILAVDRYGDADLTRFCSDWFDYNDSNWIDQLSNRDAHGLIGVGGFERTPHLERICLQRNLPIFYTPEAVDQSINDPANLARLANDADMGFPDTWQWDHVNYRYRRIAECSIRRSDSPDLYLLKPVGHAGGIGIRRALSFPQEPSDHWVQRFCHGLSIGACYLACPCASEFTSDRAVQSHLLGVCQSLIASEHPTDPFIYRGSVGGLELPASVRHRIKQAGQIAATRFGLTGLFNIDFILNDCQLFLLEINPRYSASMELLAGQPSTIIQPYSLIDWHVRSFQRDASLSEEVQTTLAIINAVRPTGVRCKLIIYAERKLVFDESIACDVLGQAQRRYAAIHPHLTFALADVPSSRTESNLEIGAGQPVCTVLIRGMLNAHSVFSVADYAEKQLLASLKTV